MAQPRFSINWGALAKASLLAGVIGAALVVWPGLQCMFSALNNEQFSNLSEAEEVWVYGGRQDGGSARPGSGAQGVFSRRLFGGILPCSWAALRHADDWKAMLAVGGLVGFVLLSWFNHLSWRRGVVQAARAPVRGHTTQAYAVAARPSAAGPIAGPSGSRTDAHNSVAGSRSAASPTVSGAYAAAPSRGTLTNAAPTPVIASARQPTGSPPAAVSVHGAASFAQRPSTGTASPLSTPTSQRFASDDDWDDVPVPAQQPPDPGSPFDHQADEQFLIDAGLQDRPPSKNRT